MKRPWYERIAWIDRIEPETSRSGTKGAVMAIAFLMFFVTPVGSGGFSPVCFLIPGFCTGTGDSDQDVARIPRYRMTPVVFFGSSHGHGCSCHLDMKYNGQEVMHFKHVAYTCDSEFDGDAQNTWYVPGHDDPEKTAMGWGVVGTDGLNMMVITADNGKYQWHCEGT